MKLISAGRDLYRLTDAGAVQKFRLLYLFRDGADWYTWDLIDNGPFVDFGVMRYDEDNEYFFAITHDRRTLFKSYGFGQEWEPVP